jgi:rubredoxin
MDRLEKHCIKDHKMLGDSAVDETATDIRDNLVCPMCDKNFKQLHILRKHKEIEHKFLCPACDKKFTMKHWLREHMKIVHDIEDELKPSFACEMCDNTFSDNYGRKRHLKIEHTHDCSFCDK